jgi:hypothetical protein
MEGRVVRGVDLVSSIDVPRAEEAADLGVLTQEPGRVKYLDSVMLRYNIYNI